MPFVWFMLALVAVPVVVPAADGVLDAGEAGFLGGRLLPGDLDPDAGPVTVRWQSPLFESPFEFRLAAISGMRFVPRPGMPRPGPFVFLLRGGDGIPGELVDIDATHVVALVAGATGTSRLRLERSAVERIVRAGDLTGGAGSSGPGSLVGWEQTPPNSWREEAGAIVTSRRGATVSGDVAAPARGRFDLVVGVRRLAAFRVGIGAGPPGSEPFRLELLRPAGGAAKLVLVREERRAADVREVLTLEPGTETIRVSLFIDQAEGRLVALVPAPDAAPTRAEITLAPEAGGGASGRIRVTVSSGELRLESLRVTPWSTPAADLEPPRDPFVAARGGRPRLATIESLDAATGELVCRGDSEPVRLRLAEVDEIGFGSGSGAEGLPLGGAAGPVVRVVRVTGETLAGRLAKVADDAVWIARAGIDLPVPVPLAALAVLRSLRTEPPDEPAGRVGRLVAEGVNIRGCLAAGPAGTALGWQPLGSVTAAAFRAGPGEPLSAAVNYVDLPDMVEAESADVRVGGIGGAVNPDGGGSFVVTMMSEDGAAARDGRLQPGDRLVAISPEKDARFVATRGLELNVVMNLLRGRIGTPVRLKVTDAAGRHPREIDLERGPIGIASGQVLRQALEAHAQLAPPGPGAGVDAEYPARLVLVDGDTVACRVVAVAGDGARVVSAVARPGQPEALVPHDRIRAVELAPAAAGRTIDRQRFDRLLTLPRAQRADPPTHLLRLADGDYLRGKLLALDERQVKVDLLGTRKELPRADVVRIIWLHPEPDADAAPPPPPSLGVPRVLGIATDGGRLALAAAHFEGGRVVGTNPALGDCGIDVGTLARLLIGPHAAAKPERLPYGRWRLRPAAEPRPPRGQPAG